MVALGVTVVLMGHFKTSWKKTFALFVKDGKENICIYDINVYILSSASFTAHNQRCIGLSEGLDDLMEPSEQAWAAHWKVLCGLQGHHGSTKNEKSSKDSQ